MPLLGPIADGFDDWLAASGFTRGSRKLSIRCCRSWIRICAAARVDEVAKLNHTVLDDCWKALMKKYPCRAGTVHTLERYLVASGLIVDRRNAAATQPSSLSEEYANHLREVRGFAASTVSSHRRTAQCFLQHLEETGTALRMHSGQQYRIVHRQGRQTAEPGNVSSTISARCEVSFASSVRMAGRPPGWIARSTRRDSIAWSNSHVPSRGKRSAHFCNPWIRTSPMGLRDYAMFLLIATYGLRASEVVAISLEDIRWRQRILRIHQRKTSSPLELPLTNEVLSALVKHLKRTPPPAPYRRVFSECALPWAY